MERYACDESRGRANIGGDLMLMFINAALTGTLWGGATRPTPGGAPSPFLSQFVARPQ